MIIPDFPEWVGQLSDDGKTKIFFGFDAHNHTFLANQDVASKELWMGIYNSATQEAVVGVSVKVLVHLLRGLKLMHCQFPELGGAKDEGEQTRVE